MNEPLRVFIDFEYTGLHQQTTPISLGCVCDGHMSTFYAEFTDYDASQVTPWVSENVLSKLRLTQNGWNDTGLPDAFYFKGPRAAVAAALFHWLNYVHMEAAGDFPIQMWGDVLAYDWVLFRDLFREIGRDVPRYIYYIPFDISTLMLVKGVDPDIDRRQFVGAGQEFAHDALQDAAAIGLCYHKLMES